MSSSRRPSVMTTDLTPEEREAKLKQWLQRKELLDKGLELFAKLDPARAETDESLREAATSAYAIDKLVGNTDIKKTPKDSISSVNKHEMKKAQKTMQSQWTKWAREHHTFSNVKFTAEQASQFSATVREFLDQEGDHFILMSLKYSFPAKPKPNQKPRPLSSDQILQNEVFNQQCKKIWKQAKEIVESGGTMMPSESSAKAGAEVRGSSSKPTSLFQFGLPLLRLWLEEDEDKAQARAKELASEKNMDKKVAFEGFVKNKDSLRIKLPSKEAVSQISSRPQSAPRMNFGRVPNSVRPKMQPPPMTTAELLAGSGLKYAHATRRGNQGLAGDLELSRKKLLEMGFVDKANLEVDPEEGISLNYAYQKALEENETLQDYKKIHEKTSMESGKAFDQWLALKTIRDQALKYLSAVPPPLAPQEDREEDMRMGFVAESKSSGAKYTSYSGPTVELCIEVGKALKRVDRGLMSEWMKWSAAVIPPFNATVLWDSFFPLSCDVHSVLGSQVRETFLRILKPGLNFKEAFKQFADRKVRRREASENRDYSKEEREEVIRKTNLSKKDMTQLLLELGVSMKPHEINALIDAFDSNGDGVVSMQEFLEFTGPTRTTNAGALSSLNQKCCWRTTCKKTGMGNAYAVSNLVKTNGLDSESKDDIRSEKGERTQIIKLANGEKRLRIEMQERQKRLEILRRYGIIADEGGTRHRSRKGNKRSGRKGDASSDDDNYETDEFNDEGDYGDDFENEEGKNEQVCQYRVMSDSDRRKGLEFLEQFSREKRQEKALQSLLTDGTPPSAPALWAVNHKDPDAVDEGINFSTELWLKWQPKAGELVSFFSLECSEPSGSGRGDYVYKEVYRDPPDANPDSKFTMNYRMSKLSPGTTYMFRIRGVNGYGPGDFLYKSFTTYPGAPMKPRIIKVNSTSVTFRWVLSPFFMKRLAELKDLFAVVDSDGSGNVSREELSAALDERSSRAPDLQLFLQRAQSKLGIASDSGFAALFDNIEGNDDEEISWEEFEKFFLAVGWCDPVTDKAADEANIRDEPVAKPRSGTPSGTLRMSGGADSVRTSRTTLKSETQGSGSQAFSVVSKLSYVVEQCESEFDNIFKEVLRTTAGEATITRLEPGKSYRFRVYAKNTDGGEGPKSDTVIVHAMLETPRHPTVSERWPTAPITATSIALQWRDRRHGVTSRDKGVIKRMIGDWTGAGEDSGGVSVEMAFAEYDIDKNGEMDFAEFAHLLSDLGVECSKERLDAAFNMFDTNSDGVLSFAEFSAFWRRDEVTYTLKRSEPIPPLPVKSTALDDGVGAKRIGQSTAGFLLAAEKSGINSKAASTRRNDAVSDILLKSTAARRPKDVPTPITSYRGSSKIFEERGLIPNSLYHFKLRYVGSRVNSQLSAPLVVMSAPLKPPGVPAVIRCTGTSIKLKWYPPKHGAYKFEVQLMTVSTPANSTSQGWTNVYNGQENTFMTTTLAPDSQYKARVLSINYQGTPSEPSEEVSFRTLPRSENKEILTPKNVSSSFTIECVKDICVGDIILMTERLFAKVGTAIQDDIGGTLGPQSSVRLDRGVRMDLSVTSVTGQQPTPGSFIGERTIAAHVIRDNYRSFRSSSESNVVNPMTFCKSRRLWLEVIWEKSSTEACKQYKLNSGTIIERTQSHFEQFEVFRTVWVHEASRLSFSEEIESLSDCFLVADV